MHTVGSASPWLFRYDYSRLIDFCLWVLEKDGLQVSPFDAHLPGDNSLRQAGLQASEWLEWLKEVVNLHEQQRQVVLQKHMLGGQGSLPSEILMASDPPSIWRGNAQVKQHLQELWTQYQPVSSTRRKWLRALTTQIRSAGQQLWHDLQLYQTRLPALMVYFVEYPQQVLLPIPPISIIMTVVNGSMSGEDFRRQILQTVKNGL